MTEEQIAALYERLEHLEAQNEDYEAVLGLLRPMVAQKMSLLKRRKLLQVVEQSKSPL